MLFTTFIFCGCSQQSLCPAKPLGPKTLRSHQARIPDPKISAYQILSTLNLPLRDNPSTDFVFLRSPYIPRLNIYDVWAHQEQEGGLSCRPVCNSISLRLEGHFPTYLRYLDFWPIDRTPQNTPANNAPISSHAQQPGVSSIKEGNCFICYDFSGFG